AGRRRLPASAWLSLDDSPRAHGVGTSGRKSQQHARCAGKNVGATAQMGGQVAEQELVARVQRTEKLVTQARRGATGPEGGYCRHRLPPSIAHPSPIAEPASRRRAGPAATTGLYTRIAFTSQVNAKAI